MCIKRVIQRVTGQPDIFKGHDPSQDYLDGKMPTYTIPELIEHLEYRMMIHEDYYAKLIQGTGDYAFGDTNFHLWSLEGYSNAIHYLRSLYNVET